MRVVKVGMNGCIPCRMMGAMLTQMVNKHPELNIQIEEYNLSEKQLPGDFPVKVTSVPTILIYRDADPIVVVGMKTPSVFEKILLGELHDSRNC